MQADPPKKKKGGLRGVASPLRQDGKKQDQSTKQRGGQKETREVWVFPTRALEEVKKMMMAEGLSQEVEGQLDVENSQCSDSFPELVNETPSSEVNADVYVCVHAFVRACAHSCVSVCLVGMISSYTFLLVCLLSS